MAGGVSCIVTLENHAEHARRITETEHVTRTMSGPGRLIIHYHSEGLIRDLSAKAQQFRIETLRMGDAKSSAQSAPSGRASAGKTYVILGDGEINAGVVWEGVMAAARAAVTLKK